MYKFPSSSQLFVLLCRTESQENTLKFVVVMVYFSKSLDVGSTLTRCWSAGFQDFQQLSVDFPQEDPTSGWLHCASSPRGCHTLLTRGQQRVRAANCSPFVLISSSLCHWTFRFHFYSFLSTSLVWKPNLHYQLERRARWLIQGDILSQYLFSWFVFSLFWGGNTQDVWQWVSLLALKSFNEILFMNTCIQKLRTAHKVSLNEHGNLNPRHQPTAHPVQCKLVGWRGPRCGGAGREGTLVLVFWQRKAGMWRRNGSQSKYSVQLETHFSCGWPDFIWRLEGMAPETMHPVS